jgi:hypothetical protein
MDQTQLQEKIAEYYGKLPPKLQEAFGRMEWLERLRGISVRYNLTETQIQTLGTETSLVMLGIIHPDEYEQTLMTELAVPRVIGLKILDDINLEVLRVWRGALTETYQKNTAEAAETAYGEGKTVDERFNVLPEEVQKAIMSADYQNTILEIGKKNSLNIEETGKLDMTTTKLMLGTIHPDEYNNALSEALGLPKEKSDAIAGEVNEKILKNIRVALIAHSENSKRGEAEPAVPLPPYKNEPAFTAMSIPEAPQALPTGNPAGVLHTAGIDLVSESAQAEEKPMTEQNVQSDEQALSKSGVNLIEENTTINISAPSGSGSRSQMLSGIENPAAGATSIMGAKLSGIVGSSHASGMPASNAGGGAPHSADKYREEV